MGEEARESDMSWMDRLIVWMLDRPWRVALVLGALSFVVGGVAMHLLLERVDTAYLLGLASEPLSARGGWLDNWVNSWARLDWSLQLQYGLGLGAGASLWTFALAEPRLWRRAVCATLVLLVVPVSALASTVPESLLASAPLERLHVAGRWVLAGPIWIVCGAVCGSILALLAPRGLTGGRVRLLALIATGAAALGPVVPPVVWDGLLEARGEAHMLFWVQQGVNAVAGLLWSVLWIRRGHSWMGWWGVALLAGLALGLAGQAAQEWYYAAEHGREPYWSATWDLLWHRIALLVVVAPFLELARRADGLTTIPQDHPVRDGVRLDGVRTPVREFRRTRPLPPPPDEVPDPRPVVGPWGFSLAPEPSHGRALYFVSGLLTALPITLAEGWVRNAFRTGRPFRRIVVGLVLAAVIWAVVQRRRHGPRYHLAWMVWGLVGGLVAWAMVFKTTWF